MNHRSHVHLPALFLIASVILACGQFAWKPTATPEPTATETPPTLPVPADPDAGSAGLGDSLYPGFGNGGYQVEHYTLEITVHDVSTSDMTALTTIEAKATQDLSQFNLDFIGFEITSITVDGEPAEYERSGQELTVAPSKPIASGQAFTIVIQYAGAPEPLYSQALPFQTGWVIIEGGSFVLSEPDGSASFYPVNDHPLDKATYTIRVTVPEPFEAAANGVQTETIEGEDSTTFVFEMRDPMASYLTTINIDEFEVETMESDGGIPIRNYYSSSLPAEIRTPFARQSEMLDHFSGLFGPYPFEVYGALVMDTEFGAALENQTLSIFGMDMVDLDDMEFTELVVAHELAHQWYGDSVSVADWGDIWLNEGFATYAEGMWLEHIYGRQGMDGFIESIYTEVAAAPDFYPPPGDPAANDLFNGGVYLRGGLTLHALRLEIGDAEFFALLRTYHDRFEGGNASTEDFIGLAEEFSGEQLDELFDAWLYQSQLPPIPELGLSAE